MRHAALLTCGMSGCHTVSVSGAAVACCQQDDLRACSGCNLLNMCTHYAYYILCILCSDRSAHCRHTCHGTSQFYSVFRHHFVKIEHCSMIQTSFAGYKGGGNLLAAHTQQSSESIMPHTVNCSRGHLCARLIGHGVHMCSASHGMSHASAGPSWLSIALKVRSLHVPVWCPGGH
jgi:hypothetical protein